MTDLLQLMVESRQLSASDAEWLAKQHGDGAEGSFDSEPEILRWLAQEYAVSYSDLEQVEVEKEVLSLFPARLLLKEELLPLQRSNGSVDIATSRLFATQGLDTLKSLTGLKLNPVLAPSEAIQREIKKRLGVGADTIDTLKDDASFQVVNDELSVDTDLENAAEDASIIRFVNQVLSDAIDLRATDIHLEPFENELQIRYRIDGVLQDVPVPSEIKRFQPAIVSRVKILSQLNIAEKRLPQDGRIKLKVRQGEVDVRVSIIPMLHGEAVVMRLLRQDGSIPGLNQIGMAERELALFEQILEMPHGIFLVTGPTGSGKTTTLYTALNTINDTVRKIITVEDPVEYQIRGINQIQVSEKSGLTFARGLRAILRHDPDVVLIGEIRDEETARIAIQASLTGHLVFSTLHTNDAPSAMTRLIDMGIEPYLVASSLEGVLAQRLIRTLCTHCRVVDTSERVQTLRESLKMAPETVLYQATGCQECRQTGYHGRRAVFEMMAISHPIRQKILQHCSSGELKQIAQKEGMRTLSQDGWRLVEAGVTTPDEILRVTKDDVLSFR
ncbi:MAG TPA: general secretion pathway protein GspE [Verrucomicrobiales bacterium]|nr:general secretion pathway protein GspE [Pedosphaera sp.]HCB97708.1 general secretion pathway protein GspE [Verrucomicrobiales bacterium]